jgi:hypothetical protein
MLAEAHGGAVGDQDLRRPADPGEAVSQLCSGEAIQLIGCRRVEHARRADD